MYSLNAAKPYPEQALLFICDHVNFWLVATVTAAFSDIVQAGAITIQRSGGERNYQTKVTTFSG
jgi:hypothetical protein